MMPKVMLQCIYYLLLQLFPVLPFRVHVNCNVVGMALKPGLVQVLNQIWVEPLYCFNWAVPGKQQRIFLLVPSTALAVWVQPKPLSKNIISSLQHPSAEADTFGQSVLEQKMYPSNIILLKNFAQQWSFFTSPLSNSHFSKAPIPSLHLLLPMSVHLCLRFRATLSAGTGH